MSAAGGAAEKVPRKNLNEQERGALIEELLMGNTRGKLVKGNMLRVAQIFGCSRYQVSAVWHRYKQQKDAGIVAVDLRNKRPGNSGRKGIDVAAVREKSEGFRRVRVRCSWKGVDNLPGRSARGHASER